MDENTNQGSPEFDAGAAVENLLAEQPAVEETQEEQAEELSPEEARKAEINEGINTLIEDGWTAEEILAFSQDAGAQEDIQKNGKTVRQAARAYERRLRQAGNAEQKPAAKRGVPTVKSASGNGAGGRDQIAEMSDKEFDAFYKQAMADSLAGKKRRL